MVFFFNTSLNDFAPVTPISFHVDEIQRESVQLPLSMSCFQDISSGFPKKCGNSMTNQSKMIANLSKTFSHSLRGNPVICFFFNSHVFIYLDFLPAKLISLHGAMFIKRETLSTVNSPSIRPVTNTDMSFQKIYSNNYQTNCLGRCSVFLSIR